MQQLLDPMHVDIACKGILVANTSAKHLHEKVKELQTKVLEVSPQTEERVNGLLLGIVLAGLDGLRTIEALQGGRNPEMELQMASVLSLGLFGDTPDIATVKAFMESFEK